MESSLSTTQEVVSGQSRRTSHQEPQISNTNTHIPDQMLTVEVFTSRFSRGSNQIIHFQSGTLGPPKREAGNLAIQFGTGSGPGICFTSSQRSVTSCCIRDLRLSVPCNKHHPNARESNRRPPRTAKKTSRISVYRSWSGHTAVLFSQNFTFALNTVPFCG